MQHTVTHIADIPVIFAPDENSHSTTIEILAKAGSIYETAKTNGISHFLEHMFFKGGKTYKTPKVVAATIDAFGGEFNAFTGSEYAGYYVKSAPAYLETSLDVLADMMMHPQFPQDEMEREKQVVIQEIRMYEDMPQQHALHNWQRRYYGDNSYGRETLGTVETVQSFTRDDLYTHKDSLYTKDNIVISVAGKIPDQEKLTELIAGYFDDLPASRSASKPPYPEQRPEQQQKSDTQGTQQTHLVIAAPGVTLHDDEKYACNLVGNLLGGTMSSRLFQEVREKKGLCYYINAKHHSQDNDGLFLIRAGIEKDRWEFGLESVYHEVERLAQGDVDQDDYETALGNIKGKTQLALEGSSEVAHFFAMQHLLTGKIITLTEILDRYRQVTLADLKTTANRLKKTNLYAYWLA